MLQSMRLQKAGHSLVTDHQKCSVLKEFLLIILRNYNDDSYFQSKKVL